MTSTITLIPCCVYAIRNMLDMHRANSNQLELHPTPIDVKRDILLPVASMLYSRGCDFEIIIECEPEHLIIMADKLRLRQICLNLARNSVKVCCEIGIALQIAPKHFKWLTLSVTFSLSKRVSCGYVPGFVPSMRKVGIVVLNSKFVSPLKTRVQESLRKSVESYFRNFKNHWIRSTRVLALGLPFAAI